MCLRISFYIRFRSGGLHFVKKSKSLYLHAEIPWKMDIYWGKYRIYPAGTSTFGIPTLGLTHVSDPWLVPLHKETYNKGRKFCQTVAKADLKIHR
jgi:hypothetical protein